MGVKGLWSLLNPVARPVQIESLEGKRLAIDSSIWLYQFQSTMRDKDGRVLTNAHVLGFLRRINKLLFHGIKPVFVFDGGAPALKRSTIAERKRKKAGAAFNAAKMAEKLLQAQMRREALRLAQQAEATRAARDAEAAYVEEGGESIPANAVYLDQLEGGSGSVGGSTGRAPPVPEEEDELAAKRKRRDKHLKKDRYYLPEATVPSYSTEEKPDARLATEEELRQFIDDVHPEDIDVESAEFRALPTEVQYEIIGDLRIKSRQQSHKRLTDMLAGAPTALDFSKAQIKHLGQRNALTQQLLTVTDMVGKAHLTIPVRVAAERNRQYLLVKRDDGGGWALGIREGTKDRPIVLEPETEADRVKKEHEEVESGSESDFDSSSDIEEYKPPPDDDLRKHRRAEILEAIARRYAPATSKRSLDVAITPFGRARAPGAQPLFDSAEEPEDAAPVVTANDEALALALQKEELGEDEDEADPELARALALSRREAAEREQEQEPAKPADLALPSDEEDEFEEVALVPSRSLTPGNVSAGHDEPIVVGDSESEDDLVEAVPQPPEVPIPELSDERGPRASAAASRSASRTANLVAQSRPQPQPKTQPQPQAQPKPQPQFQPTLRLEASSDDDEFEEVPTPTATSESPAGFVPKPARARPAPRPNLSKLVQMSRPKTPEPESSPEPDLEPMQEPSPEVDVQDQRSPSYEPPRRGAPSPSPGSEEGPFDSLRRAPSPSPGPEEGPFDSLRRAPSPSPPPESDDGPLAGLRRAPSPSPPPFETPASLLEPEQTIQDESARDEPAEETAEPTLQDAPARSRRYDYDSDEDEPIEWSRSPTPQPRAQNEAVSALRRTSTAISLASEPDGDDEDEMAPADMVAEEDDYARFLAQIKNRDLNEVRGEIDDEIRVLNAQKQAAQRDSDEITHSMVVQIQTLLRHFGIPYITAPMEAEAQCAKLAELGLVDGIITDDSDVFLFGGTQCFKNIFNDAKFAECFLATDIERELSLTRERLVSLSYLLGSDYTLGLPGVGPVLALELLANFPGPDGLVHFRDWWLKVQAGTDTEDEADTKWKKSFKKRFADTLQLNHSWPDPHVREAYLYPTADESDEPFHWGFPRLAALRTFLHEELSWSISKVDDELTPIVQRIAKRGKGQLNTQGTLLPFFDNSAGAGVSYAPRRRTTANMSKRLMSVIKQFREAEAAAKGQEGVEWGEMLAGVDESDPKGRKRADESDAGKAKASAKGKAPAKGKGKAPAKPKTKKAAPKRKRTSKSKSTTQSDDEEDEDEYDPEVEAPPKRAKRRTTTRSASAAGRSTRGSTLEA